MNPLTDLERRITARRNATNSVAAHDAYGMVLQDLVAVQATHTPEGGGALDAWLVEKIAKCDEELVAQKPPLWLWHEWRGARTTYRAVRNKIASVRATHPAPPDAATHREVALQRQVVALTAQLHECEHAAKGQAELRKADGERIAALDLAYLVLCGERDDAEQKIVALTRRIVEMEVRLGEHEWDARTDPVMPAPVPNWQPFCEAQADTMTERIFGEYATRATPDDADHGVQDAPDATADRSHLIVRLHINPHTGKPGKSYVDANDVRRVVADALAERDAAMPDA